MWPLNDKAMTGKLLSLFVMKGPGMGPDLPCLVVLIKMVWNRYHTRGPLTETGTDHLMPRKHVQGPPPWANSGDNSWQNA